MPDPRLPRGAFARLAFVGAILVAPHLARASGRGWQAPASGEAQIVGNSDVVAEASRWIGRGNMTGRPGAWCAWFASFVLTRTGHEALANGLASSALSYGAHLSSPRVGALAVMPHHVGFVEDVEPDGSIRIISGNWGRRVARAVVPRVIVTAFVEVR